MQAILYVTIPFFALVWLGLLAARSGALPLDAVPGLNSFVLFFALPCMLFRFGYTLPLSELLDPVVITVYLLCALVIVVFTVAVTVSPRVPMKDAAFGALVAAFPNSGFMGVPLLTAIAGSVAAGPVLSSLLCDIFITSSLCIALAQSREDRDTLPAIGPGPGYAGVDSQVPDDTTDDTPMAARAAVMWRLIRATMGNPLPWSIALGAGFSALGVVLPVPIDRIVAMLGDAATPVALFTIGAVLWRSKVHAEELQDVRGTPLDDDPVDPARLATSRFAIARHAATRGVRSQWQLLRPDLPVTLIKLVLHPLLVLVVGLGARGMGAPLSSFQLAVLVLVAALPSASNVSVLAERYRADSGRIARIIMSSTALSFISFSVIAWSFGMQPR
jgi:predicted permease